MEEHSKDRSVYTESKENGYDYLNNLVLAVCLGDDSLEKYKKVLQKRYPEVDFYGELHSFMERYTALKSMDAIPPADVAKLLRDAAELHLTEETTNLLINDLSNQPEETADDVEDMELRDKILELKKAKQYRQAYGLCQDCIRTNKNVTFATDEKIQLAKLLSEGAKKDKKKELIIAIVISIVSFLLLMVI